LTGATLLGCALMAGSALLLLWHLRAWRLADNGALSDVDYQFHRRQFFYRLASSGTIGVIGGLMVGDRWIEAPLIKLAYWGGIAALVLVMVMLALRDWLASRLYFEREATNQAVEHAELRAEIERFRREIGDDEEMSA
jgi:hypothetical protein